MALKAQIAAQLKQRADSGDHVAKALVENVRDIKLTAGAEAANVIKVTGQILDGVGLPVAGVKEVVVESLPLAGVGTMTDGGAGALVKGSGTVKVWLTTDATGKFEIDVLNATAEANLIIATTADGDVAMLRLTFA